VREQAQVSKPNATILGFLSWLFAGTTKTTIPAKTPTNQKMSGKTTLGAPACSASAASQNPSPSACFWAEHCLDTTTLGSKASSEQTDFFKWIGKHQFGSQSIKAHSCPSNRRLKV
jgi:hypothetical protein